MESEKRPLDFYQIGNRVAETVEHRFYFCTQIDSGRECLLQVGATAEQNGGLDRGAYILGELINRAEKIEEEWAERNPKANPLNYKLAFPELIETFICPEQGERRINILAFRGVEKINQMVPLIGITVKDKLRVDLRTSAWIMGKLLKLLVFTQNQGVVITQLSGNNILIEPDKHYILVLDWSGASLPFPILPEDKCKEIADAAKAVITVLGGNPETGEIPNDGEEHFDQYVEHLLMLAQGKIWNAIGAHEKFYELIDEFWKKGFHPFTVKPL